MAEILTVNIGAAGLVRAEAQLGWLLKRSEEIFILTETSAGPGTAHILDHFRRAGYVVFHEPGTEGERGVAIVSAIPARRALVSQLANVSIPCRIVAAVLETEPAIHVVGLYIPSRNQLLEKVQKKQAFIDSLSLALGALPQAVREHLVVGGDYNVIGADHHPAYPQFMAFEYGLLTTLESYGLVDAHRHHHPPGTHEYTWVGRTGDGYRYDYFYVGGGLAERITGLAYIHETRNMVRITDHSAVVLGLQLHVPRLLDLQAANEEDTLF